MISVTFGIKGVPLDSIAHAIALCWNSCRALASLIKLSQNKHRAHILYYSKTMATIPDYDEDLDEAFSGPFDGTTFDDED